MSRGASGVSLQPDSTTGRVVCGKEDWGAFWRTGDELPCGCALDFGRSAPICKHACHDTARFFRRAPAYRPGGPYDGSASR